mmetsp:Transcript_18074/g.30844  ORF Transcript_18074/g.30844 Transcript_18074/m.30844 type:complete len:90 (+) Transcript_18074:642-911(+)
MPITQDQLNKERKAQAEEIDTQVMDLENMKFSAKDLKDFSTMTEKNSGKNFQQRDEELKQSQLQQKNEQGQNKKSKNFYEQIYEQKQNN